MDFEFIQTVEGHENLAKIYERILHFLRDHRPHHTYEELIAIFETYPCGTGWFKEDMHLLYAWCQALFLFEAKGNFKSGAHLPDHFSAKYKQIYKQLF